MRGEADGWRRIFGDRRILSDRRGAISVLTAFVIVAVIGMSALALEYGHALLQRTENQRAADLAAYAGALVYGSTGSTSSAEGAASNVAALNGFSSGVSPSVVASPVAGDTNSDVKVTVTSDVPLLLARVLTSSASLPVSATAYAEVKTDAPGCIIALSGSGSGVSLSGGTSITADSCAVASNSAVSLTGGTQITTKNIDYGTSYSVSGGSSIVPPSGTSSVTYSKVTTSDPLSASSGSPGSTEVTNATAHLGFNSSGTCAGTAGTVCDFTTVIPTAPTGTAPTGGTAVDFKYTALASTTLPTGCSDSYASSTHTVTCTGAGPFDFGAITMSGGLTINFTGSASAVYNFSSGIASTGGDPLSFGPGTYNVNGSITSSSAALSFGAGTYNIWGAISTKATSSFGAGNYNISGGISSSGTTTFGAGTFNIGTTTCSSAPSPNTGYSICIGSGTLSMGASGGSSTFVLAGGIYVPGGATLTMGSGGSNSYEIGAAADGFSIDIGGGDTVTLGDATGSGDVFETAGNIWNGGSSSTCLTLPAAAEHDINGYVLLQCGATLGSGTYTVTGYVDIGGSGGGGSVTGNNVTLVVGGASFPSSGTCAGLAFCVAGGFSNVTLTAPTSGITEDLAVIGPPSSSVHNTAGALFTRGSSGTTISGAFYFPTGAVNLGGSGTLNSSGGCLELVGSQVTLTGGSAATSTCSGLSGSSLGTTVTMVQ